MVRDGKVIRGFIQDKTHVDLGGRISFNSNQLQQQLQTVKTRSKCFSCGEVGHWAGDAACKKGGKGGKGKKGSKTKTAGRKGGGFLRRAGLAAVSMLSASDAEGFLQQLTTVCNISGVLHGQLQDMARNYNKTNIPFADHLPIPFRPPIPTPTWVYEGRGSASKGC